MVLEWQSFYCITNLFFRNAKVSNTYFSIAILIYAMLILVLHLLTLVCTITKIGKSIAFVASSVPNKPIFLFNLSVCVCL